MESATCPHCSKTFFNGSGRNRHIRKVHLLEVENTNQKTNHIFCPLCLDDSKANFAKYILLNQHITDVHNIKIKEEKLSFPNHEAFESWRAQEERNVNYANERSVNCTDKKIVYYNCNRRYQSTATKRMVKKGGSIKIDGVCPSRIIAHFNNNGQVEVNFVETHVGHTSSFRSQRLTITQREELANKLKAGIPKKRIIQDARKIKGTELERINFLNNQDLANISAQFNIENRRDPDDMIAVSMKVEEWNSGDKAYAFLYKKIGDAYPKLEKNDFALGFINKSMETKLKNYSRIICMDGTHGTNNRKFELTIMMVKDNQDIGFPVAFFISNRQDQLIQEIFLEEFKARIGEEIKPEYLMSDNDPKYHNAWTTVMGNTPRRLLCAWHVRKNWTIQGKRKIKNVEIRRQMNTDLGKIMTATNEDTFWKLKNDYFKNLEDQNEVDFSNYLQRQYFPNEARIKMWAYCHRLNAGINTNMALESFNKFLKDSLDRNTQSTLEKLLDKIDEAVENKMWTTISNVERPSSNNYKDREISKAHKRAETRNLTEDIEEIEFGKFKVKSSQSDKYYFVLYGDVCNCESKLCSVCSICMHKYVCECIEYTVKNIICKHVHMVSLYERRMLVKSVAGEETGKQNLCNNELSEEKLKLNNATLEFFSEKVEKLSNEDNHNMENVNEEMYKQRVLSLLDDMPNLETLKNAVSEILPILRRHLDGSSSKKRKMDKQTYFPNQKKQRSK